jgi:hypothetical protein
MQFYPNDWQSDGQLRMCSLAARGVWLEMLCVMWKAPRRGYLESAEGVPLTPDQLSRLIGENKEILTTLLAELEAAGVYSRETGSEVIYSRRIVKDIKYKAECSAAGRKGGGNPTFKRIAKGSPDGDVKGVSHAIPKPQRIRSSEDQISIATTVAIPSGDTLVVKPKEGRKRNPILDAIATIGGGSVTELTGPAWAAAAKALSEIKEVCPDVTVEEIQRRGRNYRLNMPNAILTPNGLSKWWADSNRASPPQSRQGSLPPEAPRLAQNIDPKYKK